MLCNNHLSFRFDVRFRIYAGGSGVGHFDLQRRQKFLTESGTVIFLFNPQILDPVNNVDLSVIVITLIRDDISGSCIQVALAIMVVMDG